MKVNGIQVEEHGSGYQVTLRVHVGREEAQEGMSNEFTEGLLAGFSGCFLTIRAMEDDHDADATDTDAGGEPAATDNGAPDTGRRRRGGRDAVGGAGEAPAGGREGARDAPDAKPDGKPAGRRRRGSKPADEAAAPSAGEVKPNESPSDAPSAGRRKRQTKAAPTAEPAQTGRRRKRGEAKPDANPTEPAPTAGRRSSGAKRSSASTAKSPSKEVADINDEDLTKATSQAAQELGPDAVMDVLEQFGVAEIRDLDQGQRAEFVTQLQEARDAA